MKYTYSDEEDEGYSDATTSRRSTRNTGTHTPAEGLGPTVTLSGRQVRARQGGAYGESILSGTHTPAFTTGGYDGTSEEPEQSEGAGGRPRRAAATNASTKGWASKGGAHIEGYNSVDEISDEDDASEQDYGDDEEEDDHVSLESDKDDDDATDEEDDEMDAGEDEKKTLVVKLPVKTPTPERKTIIKLRVSPSKESIKPADFQQTVTGDQSKARSVTPAGTGASSTANADGTLSKENAKQPSPQITHAATFPSTSEAMANPISIPPKSPSNPIQSATPLSPNLAFRGSPDKPHAFNLPSVNVYGGS